MAMNNFNCYPLVYLQPDKMDNEISFSGMSSYPIDYFQNTFREIIRKDSGNHTFGFSDDFLDMICLDIDKVVKKLGGINRDSMDCCISAGCYDVGSQKYSNHRWLLVELKLNSTVAKNDKGDLEDKVARTVDLITSGRVDKSKVFVYPVKVYPRKRSLFESWKKGCDSSKFSCWECLSPKGFEDFLRLRQNIPYVPIIAGTQIKESLKDASDIDSFSNKLKYWRETAEEYKNKGYILEYENIFSIVAECYKRFHSSLENPEDRFLLELEWDFLLKFC